MLEALLTQLRLLEHLDVLLVGAIPPGALDFWRDHVTTEMIITGERRRHYLERHPEIFRDELILLLALIDPHEIHSNAVDERMAIIYRRIDASYYLRIPVWISNRQDRQNSVLSVRRARPDEVMKGRIAGRVRWEK